MLPDFLIAMDIDPVGGATKAYEVGGFGLVCLIILAIVIFLVFRFLFKRIENIDTRVNVVEDARAKLASDVIVENTASNNAVVIACSEQAAACDRQTKTIDRLIDVLGERPCFNTQTVPQPQPQISPGRTHRTPLPQKYDKP